MFSRLVKNDSIKYFDSNNSKVCTSILFVKAVFQNTIVKLCLRPLSCLLYTSPSPRDGLLSRMPSSA